jgi:hypothetical protein
VFPWETTALPMLREIPPSADNGKESLTAEVQTMKRTASYPSLPPSSSSLGGAPRAITVTDMVIELSPAPTPRLRTRRSRPAATRPCGDDRARGDPQLPRRRPPRARLRHPAAAAGDASGMSLERVLAGLATPTDQSGGRVQQLKATDAKVDALAERSTPGRRPDPPLDSLGAVSSPAHRGIRLPASEALGSWRR